MEESGRFIKRFSLVLAGVWFFFLPSLGYGCPFCELGGRDTALFIFVIFGMFSLGMVFLFIWGGRSGLFGREGQDIVLKAEGVIEKGEREE